MYCIFNKFIWNQPLQFYLLQEYTNESIHELCSSNILVSKGRFLFTFERYILFLLNINSSFMIQLEIHWMENTFFSHSFVLLCLIKVAIVQCLWLNSDFLLLYQNYRSIECYCLSLYRKKMLVFQGRLYL